MFPKLFSPAATRRSALSSECPGEDRPGSSGAADSKSVNPSEGSAKRPTAIVRIFFGLVVILAAAAPVAALVVAVLYLFQIRPIS